MVVLIRSISAESCVVVVVDDDDDDDDDDGTCDADCADDGC